MSFNQPPEISSCAGWQATRINGGIFCDEKPPLHSAFYQALLDFGAGVRIEPPKLRRWSERQSAILPFLLRFLNVRLTAKSRFASLQIGFESPRSGRQCYFKVPRPANQNGFCLELRPLNAGAVASVHPSSGAPRTNLMIGFMAGV
jgi:hypothetical protein